MALSNSYEIKSPPKLGNDHKNKTEHCFIDKLLLK